MHHCFSLASYSALSPVPAPHPLPTHLPPHAASSISVYLEQPGGAPASVGRIEERDMADVPRFLNRWVWWGRPWVGVGLSG